MPTFEPDDPEVVVILPKEVTLVDLVEKARRLLLVLDENPEYLMISKFKDPKVHAQVLHRRDRAQKKRNFGQAAEFVLTELKVDLEAAIEAMEDLQPYPEEDGSWAEEIWRLYFRLSRITGIR